MVQHQHQPRLPFRLHGPGRAVVVFVATLALAVVVGLIWASVAHPQADSVRLFGEPVIGGPAGIRRVTAWLLIAACSLVFVTGIALLAVDVQAGRDSAGTVVRPAKAKRSRHVSSA
jgi:hypothetical protein